MCSLFCFPPSISLSLSTLFVYSPLTFPSHSFHPYSLSFSSLLLPLPGTVQVNSRGRTIFRFVSQRQLGTRVILDPEIIGDPPIRSEEVIWSRLIIHLPVISDDNRVFLANFNRWLVMTSYGPQDNDYYTVKVARGFTRRSSDAEQYHTQLDGKYHRQHYAWYNCNCWLLGERGHYNKYFEQV